MMHDTTFGIDTTLPQSD